MDTKDKRAGEKVAKTIDKKGIAFALCRTAFWPVSL